jgi:exonuclease SbcC
LAAAEEQRRAAAQDLEAAWAAFAAAAGGASAEGIEAEAERIARCDASLERLTGELRAGAAALAEARSAVEGAEGRLSAAATTAAALRLGHERLEGVALTLRARLTKLLGEEPAPAAAALARVQRALEALGAAGEALKRTAAEAVELSRQAELGSGEARALETSARSAADLAEEELGHRLAERGFRDEEAARTALMAAEELAVAEAELRQGQEARRGAEAEVARLARELAGRAAPDEVLAAAERLAADADRREAEARERAGAASQVFEDLERRSIRWREVTAELARVRAEAATARDLQEALYGGRFIDFMAEEHLRRIAADGSARLAGLTRYRYALDLDSDGGFLVRDDHAGGQHRPATSLSGGETFLASLALALSLSAQIQLRGRFPLEFFFLDEGFGSLDPELLETVVTALEQLHMEHVHIGLITHVAELRSRVPARLIVEPAVSGGHGSRIRFEAG